MDLKKEEIRFENRRSLPSHLAKYKFLFRDTCPGAAIIGNAKGDYPYKVNDSTQVFYLKNSVMSDGGGGDYGGGGNYDGGVDYGNSESNFTGSYTYSNNNHSDNFFSGSTHIPDSDSTRVSVETYSYSNNTSTLPLNNHQNHPLISEAESQPQTQPIPEPEPKNEETPFTQAASTKVDAIPSIEKELGSQDLIESLIVEDKITSCEVDSGCPASILATDLLNTQDDDNNDGPLLNELTAFNNIHSEKSLNNSEVKEDSCGMDCLYFTLQCCECVIL